MKNTFTRGLSAAIILGMLFTVLPSGLGFAQANPPASLGGFYNNRWEYDAPGWTDDDDVATYGPSNYTSNNIDSKQYWMGGGAGLTVNSYLAHDLEVDPTGNTNYVWGGPTTYVYTLHRNTQTSTDSWMNFYFRWVDDQNFYRLSISGGRLASWSNTSNMIYPENKVKLSRVVGGVETILHQTNDAIPVPTMVAGTTQAQYLQNITNSGRTWASVKDAGKRFYLKIFKDADGVERVSAVQTDFAPFMGGWPNSPDSSEVYQDLWNATNAAKVQTVLFTDIPTGVTNDTGSDALASGRIGVGSVNNDVAFAGVQVYNQVEAGGAGKTGTGPAKYLMKNFKLADEEWDTLDRNVIVQMNHYKQDHNAYSRRILTTAGTGVISKAIYKQDLTLPLSVTATMFKETNLAAAKGKWYFCYQNNQNNYFVTFDGMQASTSYKLFKTVDGVVTEIPNEAGANTFTLAGSSNDNPHNVSAVRLRMEADGTILFEGVTAKSNYQTLVKAKDNTFTWGKWGFETDNMRIHLTGLVVVGKERGKITEDFSDPGNLKLVDNGVANISYDRGFFETTTVTGEYTSTLSIPTNDTSTNGFKLSFRMCVNNHANTESAALTVSMNNYWMASNISGANNLEIKHTYGSNSNRVRLTRNGTLLGESTFDQHGYVCGSSITPATNWMKVDIVYNSKGLWTIDLTPESGTQAGKTTRAIVADDSVTNASASWPRPPANGTVSFNVINAKVMIDDITYSDGDFSVYNAQLRTNVAAGAANGTAATATNNLFNYKAAASVKAAAGKTVTAASLIGNNTVSLDATDGKCFVVLRDENGVIVDVKTTTFGVTAEKYTEATTLLDIPAAAATVPYTVTFYYLDNNSIAPFVTKASIPSGF